MISRLRSSTVLRELWRVAPVRFSSSAIGRAAVATGAPLLFVYLVQRPELFWMATGGFLGALVDRDRSYRARALNFAAVATAMAAAGALAALLGHRSTAAVAGMLVWGGAVSFLRVYGATGANVGLTSSVIFAVSLGNPLAPPGALERGAALFAGGGWAGLLALFLWPLRPHVPVRRAVAHCYRALAAYARELQGLAERGGGEHGSAGRFFDAVRQSLEEAWTALGSGWSRLPPHSHAHDQLLVLLEVADQMLGALVALSDLTERLPDPTARARLTAELRRLAGHTEALARGLERDEPDPTALPEVEWPSEEEPTPADRDDSSVRQTERLLRTLRELSQSTRELLAGSPPEGGKVPAPESYESETGGWRDPVRTNLSPDSILLRHALRVGITAGLAVLVSRVFQLQLGHWVTLTVLFVLQPNVGTTLVKAFQRVLGTATGAIAATVLPLVVHSPAVLLIVVSGLAAAAVVSLPVNYTLFTFFVTPTFVVLTELQTGVSGLATTRVVNTLIGGGLAIAGTRLVWSLPERRRFPAHAAAALQTARDYLRAAVEAPHAPTAVHEVPALRRKLGLEVINAGESLHRMALEGGRSAATVEAGRTIIVYLRRLTSASVSLAAAAPFSAAEVEPVRRFVSRAERALTDIASAIAVAQAPPALEPLIDPGWPGRIRADLERIERPLRVLHAAAERLAGAEPARRRRSAGASH